MLAQLLPMLQGQSRRGRQVEVSRVCVGARVPFLLVVFEVHSQLSTMTTVCWRPASAG